jgi:hypothetical protein
MTRERNEFFELFEQAATSVQLFYALRERRGADDFLLELTVLAFGTKAA